MALLRVGGPASQTLVEKSGSPPVARELGISFRTAVDPPPNRARPNSGGLPKINYEIAAVS